MTEILCPHCKNQNLVTVPANEPWSDQHYQCPDCDSTYNLWDFDFTVAEMKLEYEWIVKDSGDTLAYKKPGEDPVFIDAERALLQCITVIETMQKDSKKAQHLLADLTRLT